MTLIALDHVNIRTADLAAMVSFYSDVLELAPGPRPPFSFNGAWLYCGANAAIHLVERAIPPREGEPHIEHFAFRAENLAAFLERLRIKQVPYQVNTVPGLGLRQVHVRDPDGNHIEIAFAAHEEADLSPHASAPGEAAEAGNRRERTALK